MNAKEIGMLAGVIAAGVLANPNQGYGTTAQNAVSLWTQVYDELKAKIHVLDKPSK